MTIVYHHLFISYRRAMEPKLVYFSSVSGMTETFVNKFSYEITRIPKNGDISITEPSILVTPTYGSEDLYGNKKNSVPIAVKKMLNNEANRSNIVGVVGTGNINFGSDYGRAAWSVQSKLGIPVFGIAELTGTQEDIRTISERIDEFYDSGTYKEFIGWPKQA